MIQRHSDHDPAIICRPAFGNGLCEPLPGYDVDDARLEQVIAVHRAQAADLPQGYALYRLPRNDCTCRDCAR